MSEYMFGVTRCKLTSREMDKRDRACRIEGGYGYQQIDESHGTADGGRWIGWFSGPNRGEPFNRELTERVRSRLGAPWSELCITPARLRRTA